MATSMPDDVRDLLRRSTITETSVTLPPGQLDRKLYEAVNKALDALGGKWNRKQRAHLFTRDPRAALAAALDDGTMPVNQDKVMSFWRTPAELAERLVEAIGAAVLVDEPIRVLEPSAGDGAIAKVLRERLPDADIWCVEPDEHRADQLEDAGFEVVYRMPFEKFGDDPFLGTMTFTAAVMNPPFNTADRKDAYVEHVRLAWSMLAPGGVLAAVVPAGFATRQDRRVRQLREEVERNGGSWEALEEGAFAESGTGVRTLMLTWPAVEAPTRLTSENATLTPLTTSQETVEFSTSSDPHPVAPHPEETAVSTTVDTTPETDAPETPDVTIPETVIPDDAATHPIYEIGTRHRVAPGDLIVGANVREDVKLDAGFVKSIKALGVLQAIHAYQDEAGHLIVEDGQCRTLGAIDAEQETVPVEIIENPALAARIYQQLAQNEHRHAMTLGDTARAYRQLTLAGEKASAIQKTTGRTQKDVKRLHAVAQSGAAITAADKGLDLVQAAAVAEFSDDPDAAQKLVDAALGKLGWQTFDHVYQQLVDKRAERKAKAELRAQAEAEGLLLVDEAGYGHTEQPLDHIGFDLSDEVAIARHRETCEGHAVVIDQRHDTEAKRRVWMLVPVCVDPVANGHELPKHMQRQQPKKKAADMTDAERAKASAERKLVVENNKAWQSAVTVRREWLGEFARNRKTVPAGAEAFVLGEFLTLPWYLSNHLNNARTLLDRAVHGDKVMHSHDEMAKLLIGKTGGSAKRAIVMQLALVFAAWEGGAGDDDAGKGKWRRFDVSDTRVLRFMEKCGYGLSEVERLVAYPSAEEGGKTNTTIGEARPIEVDEQGVPVPVADAGWVQIDRELIDGPIGEILAASEAPLEEEDGEPVDAVDAGPEVAREVAEFADLVADDEEGGEFAATVIGGTVVAISRHEDLVNA